MAQKGRNLIGILITNIMNSLKPRRFRGDLIGQDFYGNKYYEITGSTKKKTSRWFEPIGGEKNFDQTLPAEWEAWLRGRRQLPPTEEEIQKSLSFMAEMKKYDELHNKMVKTPDVTKPGSGKVPFPKHEEYETFPGEKKRS